MELVVTIVAVLVVVGVAGFAYLTASVNAEADDDDAIVSVPPIEAKADAFMRALAGAAHSLRGIAMELSV